MIKVKVLLNDTLEVNGIYDSGSNVSLINSRLLKKKRKQISNTSNTNLKTINGVKKADGLITVKTKIFNIENMMDIFVINSKDFNYDFLIGLDCIKKFKLCQNEKLEIKQRIIPSLKGEEIKNNYDDKEEKNLKEERTDLIKKERRYEIKGEEKNYTINFNEHIDGKNFEIITDHLEYEEKNEIDTYRKIWSNICER